MFEVLIYACFLNDPTACTEVELKSPAALHAPYRCLAITTTAIENWQDKVGRHRWIIKRVECKEPWADMLATDE